MFVEPSPCGSFAEHKLGIHHSPESVSGVSNLSQEEQATRDRLFWAAFIWDKCVRFPSSH